MAGNLGPAFLLHQPNLREPRNQLILGHETGELVEKGDLKVGDGVLQVCDCQGPVGRVVLFAWLLRACGGGIVTRPLAS